MLTAVIFQQFSKMMIPGDHSNATPNIFYLKNMGQSILVVFPYILYYLF